MTPFLSHISLNVSDLRRSTRFYDLFLSCLGFRRCRTIQTEVGYSNESVKVFLRACDPRFLRRSYHRKAVGLNHLAFQVASREEVDRVHVKLVKDLEVQVLYGTPRAFDVQYEYYALFVEDPDRIKLEVVYSPRYMTVE